MWISGKIYKEMDLRCFSFLFMSAIVLVAENAAVHVKRVKSFLPEHGNVGIMCITDKQFGNIELFYGKKLQGVTTPGQQLELF